MRIIRRLARSQAYYFCSPGLDLAPLRNVASSQVVCSHALLHKGHVGMMRNQRLHFQIGREHLSHPFSQCYSAGNLADADGELSHDHKANVEGRGLHSVLDIYVWM